MTSSRESQAIVNRLFLCSILMVFVATCGVWTVVADEREIVSRKDKEVSKNDEIDFNDAGRTEAQSVLDKNGVTAVTSKVFTPPGRLTFKPFPGSDPVTHVDVTPNPNGFPVIRKLDDAGSIQVEWAFVAADDLNVPPAAEGNLGAPQLASRRAVAAAKKQHWSASVSAGAFDLVVYDAFAGNNRHDPLNPVPDQVEESRGAIGVSNQNDTDFDGRPDREELDESTPGECDMIKLVIKKRTHDNIAGNVRLELAGDATRVRLWKSEDKSQGIETTREWAVSGISPEDGVVRWVEGLQRSGACRDVEVLLKKSGGDGGGYEDGDILDRATLTFVWAERTALATSDMTGEELFKLEEWKKMTQPPREQPGGPRVGTGLLKYDAELGFKNALVAKYQLLPAGVHKVDGVVFDVTRDSYARVWCRNSDAETWNLADTITRFSDADATNDDLDMRVPSQGLVYTASDQSSTPNDSGEMFYADATGPQGGFDYPPQFHERAYFREFVRVRFDGVKPRGGYRSLPREDGSRSSMKYEWRAFLTLLFEPGQDPKRSPAPGSNLIGEGHEGIEDNP